ncbi:MAG: hypothetical protein JWO42_3613 [Chloroflexi bacterium]|nr:hypothetical protein [Chloroflexota bacterium]
MSDPQPQSDLLITGARVYTADPQHPWAEAVLTRGNTIRFVGSAAEARDLAGSSTERIHLPGALVVPGLNDSHIHMTLAAASLDMLDLTGVTALPELQARLRAFALANPDRPWLEAQGLPYEPLDNLDRPERVALDEAVGDRPVYIRSFDWHTSWTNSVVLQRAGIERGANIPLPNEVVVDPATGLSTGMLKERMAQELVTNLMEPPSTSQRDDMLCRAMTHLNHLGITSVQNLDGDPERLRQYDRLHAAGRLSIRAGHYMSIWSYTPRSYVAELAETVLGYTSAWSHALGIKLFIDGVVETETALLFEPYMGTDATGVPDMDLQQYHEIVLEADRRGMNVATHAIGDRGFHLTLNAYEEAARANGPRPGRRHRVEHIEVSRPDDIPRLARLGVTASMQPLHAAPGSDPRFTPWTRLVGPTREPYGFVWRRIAETGAALAFGSDWPIVKPDVRAGLYTALTRKSHDGMPAGGWQPQHCVTLAQALDAYTSGAAYAEGQEHVKGKLRAGMLADITVFARDLFQMAPHEIPQAEIALTVLDGRVLFRSA